MDDEELQGTPTDTGLLPMFFWSIIFPLALGYIGHYFGLW